MSERITPAAEADILLEAQERAMAALRGEPQGPDQVLLAARQKAERVLQTAQRKAETLLLAAEDKVREGLPELPEEERLVRAVAAADALEELRRAAVDALGEVEWATADVLLKAHREAAAILMETRMRILDGRA